MHKNTVVIGLRELPNPSGGHLKIKYYEALKGLSGKLSGNIDFIKFGEKNIHRYPQLPTGNLVSKLVTCVFSAFQTLPLCLMQPILMFEVWRVCAARVNSKKELFKLVISFPVWASSITKFINHNTGKTLICWGAYHAAGRFFNGNRVKFDKLIFMEFGMLPGSLSIDTRGLYGESWVVEDLVRYSKLKVTPKDICKAENYITYIKESRKSNKSYDADSDSRLPEGKKIFVVGGELYAAGVLPEGTRHSDKMSDLYKTNIELLKAVRECAPDDVTVVYKSHPNMAHLEIVNDGLIAAGVIVAGNEDIFSLINKVDVVVTILSSVAQLAIISGIPAVIAGRNPMWGKGCCYEVESRCSLQPSLAVSLSKGLSVEQNDCFRRYVARELRYSLYFLDCQYGRGLDQLIHDLNAGHLGDFP